MERDNISVHTPAEGVRIIGADAADPNIEPKDAVDLDLTELESPNHNLPHWTEPATGQIPSVLASVDAPSAEDELSSGPVWRDDHTGWEDEAVVDQLITDEPVEAEPVVTSTPARSRVSDENRSVTISSRSQSRTPFDGERMSAE